MIGNILMMAGRKITHWCATEVHIIFFPQCIAELALSEPTEYEDVIVYFQQVSAFSPTFIGRILWYICLHLYIYTCLLYQLVSTIGQCHSKTPQATMAHYIQG